MDYIEKLQSIIDSARRIVFFGGAGVSTESGIPDFRSVDGLYNQKYAFPPETILSHTFFVERPDEFYRFYHDKMIYREAKPNPAHLKLAELEKAGKLTAIVTQNIDNLHQMAGSENVFELHGSIYRNYCTKCGKFFNLDYVADCGGVPKCDKCGGLIKPDVVLYEESLDSDVLSGAVASISACDVLIVGGTSLNVYPAAGLINYYKGDKLVLVNKSKTAYDRYANLIINEKIGEVFAQIKVD